MKLAVGEPFQHDHWSGANRTAQLGSDLRMSCATLYLKQSTAAYEHTATPAVSKKAEVADAGCCEGLSWKSTSAHIKTSSLGRAPIPMIPVRETPIPE